MMKYIPFKTNLYYKDDPSVYEKAKIKTLIDISNELAETNRLKRIEILILNDENGFYNKDSLKNILEDQAK